MIFILPPNSLVNVPFFMLVENYTRWFQSQMFLDQIQDDVAPCLQHHHMGSWCIAAYTL